MASAAWDDTKLLSSLRHSISAGIGRGIHQFAQGPRRISSDIDTRIFQGSDQFRGRLCRSPIRLSASVAALRTSSRSSLSNLTIAAPPLAIAQLAQGFGDDDLHFRIVIVQGLDQIGNRAFFAQLGESSGDDPANFGIFVFQRLEQCRDHLFMAQDFEGFGYATAHFFILVL